jgi:hypothetical protein
MNRIFCIEHPQYGIFFADASAKHPRHCLMSKELARAMAKEMQAYPETRGVEVFELESDIIGLGGYRPFVLG